MDDDEMQDVEPSDDELAAIENSATARSAGTALVFGRASRDAEACPDDSQGAA